MAAEPYQIMIVSHTHWDREWYRPFQEFRLQLVRLIDHLLDILASTPGYHSFLLDGQTIVLEDYLEIRPEREADLKRYIQQGRLFVGPWHILPDEFLVGAESTVRNLMLGAQIAERFGARLPIGYTPDPFGHISQLPQILVGFGIDTAMLQRGLSEEPTELWWESPDGTRVLTIFLRAGYGNFAWAPTTTHAFVRAVELQIQRLAPYAHTPHLLLMNGTDHMMPQPELPRLIAEANRELNEDAQLEHGTLPAYVGKVRAALGDAAPLPVVRGELRSPRRSPMLVGVLSARMWIKQRNQACETALGFYAEPLSAFSQALDGQNRRGELRRAWRHLIENHPHDSICGCSIDQVHEEMRTRFAWSEQIAHAVSVDGLRFLAEHINGSTFPVPPAADEANTATYSALFGPDDLMVTVYNPIQGAQSGRVELEVPWAGVGRQYDLLDDQGVPVPVQWSGGAGVVVEEQLLDHDGLLDLIDSIEVGFYGWRLIRDVRLWIDGDDARLELVLPEYHTGQIGSFAELVQTLRTDPALAQVKRCQLVMYIAGSRKLAFVAQDIPGVGYRAYRLHTSPEQAQIEPAEFVPGNAIENEWFRVSVDETSGVLRLLDKITDEAYRGLNRVEDGGDRGDEYTYFPPQNNPIVSAPAQPPVIERLDEGALGQSLRISMVYELPASLTADRNGRSEQSVAMPVVTTVRLTPGVQRVDIRTELENQALDHRLRVMFPTRIRSNRSIADGQFDRLTRVFEMPEATTGWSDQPQPTFPQRAFCAVQDEAHGLMLAVRGLPEGELIEDENGAILALTLLRCVGWLSRDDLAVRPGHAGPGLATPGAQCLGKHVFEYSLIPFAADLDKAAQSAYAFNAPLMGLVSPMGNGMLPARQMLLTLEPANLVLTAIKPPESGEGLVVRFYNSSSETVQGRLTCAMPICDATPVNLLEQPMGESHMMDEEGGFVMEVPPKRIVSLMLSL